MAGSRDRWGPTWLRFSDRDAVNIMRGLGDIVNIPFITTDQMREVDRPMIEDYGISLVQMMENAGRNLAQLARGRFLQGDPTGRRVLVLAGKGGNGGGGMVCARRLHDWGAEVQLWMTAPGNELAGVPLHQLGILERMGIPSIAAGEAPIMPTKIDIGDDIDWATFSVWLSALLYARGDDLVRVKGVFATPAGPLLLQAVRKSVQPPELLPPGATGRKNQIVFIGRGYEGDDLRRSLDYFSRS